MISQQDAAPTKLNEVISRIDRHAVVERHHVKMKNPLTLTLPRRGEGIKESVILRNSVALHRTT